MTARAFRPLVVDRVEPLTEDAVAVTFAVPAALAGAYAFGVTLACAPIDVGPILRWRKQPRLIPGATSPSAAAGQATRRTKPSQAHRCTSTTCGCTTANSVLAPTQGAGCIPRPNFLVYIKKSPQIA